MTSDRTLQYGGYNGNSSPDDKGLVVELPDGKLFKLKNPNGRVVEMPNSAVVEMLDGQVVEVCSSSPSLVCLAALCDSSLMHVRIRSCTTNDAKYAPMLRTAVMNHLHAFMNLWPYL